MCLGYRDFGLARVIREQECCQWVCHVYPSQELVSIYYIVQLLACYKHYFLHDTLVFGITCSVNFPTFYPIICNLIHHLILVNCVKVFPSCFESLTYSHWDAYCHFHTKTSFLHQVTGAYLVFLLCMILKAYIQICIYATKIHGISFQIYISYLLHEGH